MNRRRFMVAGLAATVAVTCCSVSAAAGDVASAAQPKSAAKTVVRTEVLGHSVQGRAIRAYELGSPKSKIKVVILGQTHGDEHAGIRVADAIIHGKPISGVDLWVVPTMNPDGNHANTRGNAHGVDLNRNWPYLWHHTTTKCYVGPDPMVHATGCNSGSKPLSEPESRAMYRFLKRLRPTYLVSIHQPLAGVDATNGARAKALRNLIAKRLHLSKKTFNCWSKCYGTMMDWVAHSFHSAGILLEFGFTPSSTLLTRTAPAALLDGVHAKRAA